MSKSNIHSQTPMIQHVPVNATSSSTLIVSYVSPRNTASLVSYVSQSTVLK